MAPDSPEAPTTSPQRPDASPFPGSSAPEPAPTPEALVVLPPDPLATPAPEEGPLEYSDAEYGQLLTSQGLGEFAEHPQVLQGIRAYDRDYNIYLRDYETRLASLPPGTKGTPAAPLTGPALEQAIDTLVARYFPGATPTQRLHARPLLETSVQRTHQLTSALAAVDKVQGVMATRAEVAREAQTLAQARPGVAAMSQAEFQERSHQLFDEIRAAKEAGNFGTATALQRQHDQMFQLRYPNKGR